METRTLQSQGKYLFKPEIILARNEDEIVRDAKGILLEDYKGTAVALGIINPNDKKNALLGCNFFYKGKIAEIVRELSKEDIIPMTRLISEFAFAHKLLEELSSTYEDDSVAVRPKDNGVNSYEWKYLREQVQNERKDIDLSRPFVITGYVNIAKDSNLNNKYGVKILINPFTEVYNVDVLSQPSGHFQSNDPSLLINGFPSKLGIGNRYLTNGKNGVCRVYRYCGSWVNSWVGDLAGSLGTGRVHFTKNFSGSLEEILSTQKQFEQTKVVALERFKQNAEAKRKELESITL